MLYGNTTVGGNPVTSPVTHQHGMLGTQNLLCHPQSTGHGSGSGRGNEAPPDGLPLCSPCLHHWHQLSRGEREQFASVNTSAVRARRFPFPQSCTVSVHRQNSSIYPLTKGRNKWKRQPAMLPTGAGPSQPSPLPQPGPLHTGMGLKAGSRAASYQKGIPAPDTSVSPHTRLCTKPCGLSHVGDDLKIWSLLCSL